MRRLMANGPADIGNGRAPRPGTMRRSKTARTADIGNDRAPRPGTMRRSKATRLGGAVVLMWALLAGACGDSPGETTEPAPQSSPSAGTPEVTVAPPPEPTSEPTTEPTPETGPEPTPEATAAPEPTPEPTTRATPEPGPEPTAGSEPESHPSGLDVGAMEDAVAHWMEQARAPGLVLAVALGDDQPWTFAWGVADLATDDPMTPDDYVRIGSISKPVTTVAVLSLVDEGILDLDTPVTAYLGEDWYGDYEYGPDINLRHLLGHTAGFVEYAFDPGFFVLASARLNLPITPEEIVRFATSYGPVAELETEYKYSTAGHVIAGMVIEAVTGNTAHAEIRSRILDPLGLEHTYLPPGELPPEMVVNSYNGGILAAAFDALSDVPDEARHSFKGADYIATLSYPQEFLQSAGWTGGGMEARIGDVPQLLRGLLTGGLVNDEAVDEMTTPGVEPGYGLGMGMEVVHGQNALSHGGGVPAFTSKAIYFPEPDLSLAVSTNVLPADPDLDELIEALIKIVMESWGL